MTKEIADVTTYRAAYWTDGNSDVPLTTEDMANLTDAELMAEAARVADETGLQLGEGRIVIGDFKR